MEYVRLLDILSLSIYIYLGRENEVGIISLTQGKKQKEENKRGVG